MDYRLANIGDLHECLRMALEFKKHSPYAAMPHDVEKIKQTVEDVVKGERDSSICLLAVLDTDKPVGMIAGVVGGIMWSHDRVGRELVWWVDPVARRGRIGLKLKEGFEFWCREIAKCKLVDMAHLAGSSDLSKCYERSGYRKTEEHYVKELS